jgi:hypothetical protein
MTEYPYQFQGSSVPTGVAIVTYQSGNSSVGNITVHNNTFIAPSPQISSPVAVQASPVGPDYFHLASLTITDNILVNFPQDGKQFNVTTNPTYNPNYTNSGNIFEPAGIDTPVLPAWGLGTLGGTIAFLGSRFLKKKPSSLQPKTAVAPLLL